MHATLHEADRDRRLAYTRNTSRDILRLHVHWSHADKRWEVRSESHTDQWKAGKRAHSVDMEILMCSLQYTSQKWARRRMDPIFIKLEPARKIRNTRKPGVTFDSGLFRIDIIRFLSTFF